MTDRKRFSKQAALDALDARAAELARRFKFNRSNGTSQLEPKGQEFNARIERAVAYGQMRAYESFAEAICNGLPVKAIGDTPLRNSQTMAELAAAEKEHFGDPDEKTGIYAIIKEKT